MKVLIWIGFVIVFFIFTSMTRNQHWGGVPTMILFGALWWVALSLSKKCDKRKNDDENDDNN